MPRKKKNISGKNEANVRGKKGGTAMQQQQGAVNPFVGAAIGAAVGGIMGAAAAVALSDKETRETLKTAAGNLRDQAADRIEHMKHKAEDAASAAKDAAQKQLTGSEEKKTH